MIGREEQLNSLNQYFASEKSNLTILYGRHRIGKTALLSEFMKDKNVAYYEARPAVEFEQIECLKRVISVQQGRVIKGSSYDAVLESVLEDKKLNLLVIEEFQYLVKSGTGFMNAIADLMKSGRKIMIILTCSSVSWIENSMVKTVGGAAFSINAFMKLKEISYVDTVNMFPDSDADTLLCMYGITGGVPGYLQKWDASKSVRENVCNLFLAGESILGHEAENYVMDEFREIGVYNTILYCLASGHNKLNEIHEYTGFGRDKISVYLKNLIAREIVEKIFSYDAGGNENTRKGLYRIQDGFLNFWYRYIYPYAGMIEITKPEEFYDKYIGPQLNEFLINAFIKIAGEFMDIMNDMGRLPFKAERKGSWYGKNGDLHLIYEDENRKAVIAEVYVGKEPVDIKDYEAVTRNAVLAGIDADYFYLFSTSGFTKELADMQNQGVTLIGIDEL